MDRKDRAKVIAVKLTEVLDQLRKERDNTAEKLLDKLVKDSKLEEAAARLTQYNTYMDKLKEEIETIKKEINEKLEEQTGRTASISVSENYKSDEFQVSHGLASGAFVEEIVGSNVVSHLTTHRDTSHPRLKKVVREGMALLLEDDYERLEKFLEL